MDLLSHLMCLAHDDALGRIVTTSFNDLTCLDRAHVGRHDVALGLLGRCHASAVNCRTNGLLSHLIRARSQDFILGSHALCANGTLSRANIRLHTILSTHIHCRSSISHTSTFYLRLDVELFRVASIRSQGCSNIIGLLCSLKIVLLVKFLLSRQSDLLKRRSRHIRLCRHLVIAQDLDNVARRGHGAHTKVTIGSKRVLRVVGICIGRNRLQGFTSLVQPGSRGILHQCVAQGDALKPIGRWLGKAHIIGNWFPRHELPSCIRIVARVCQSVEQRIGCAEVDRRGRIVNLALVVDHLITSIVEHIGARRWIF